MNYTEILSRAWKITWRYKVLWIFGILSSCGQGGGNGSSRFNAERRLQTGAPGGFPDYSQLERLLQRPEVIGIIIGVVILLLVIGLIVWALSIMGRGGLIGGVGLTEDQGSVTFGEAWAIGRRVFWRLLLIRLALAAPVLILVLLGVGAAVLTAGVGLACLLPLVCVLILALIPLAVWAFFAELAVVVENLPFADAFRKAWQVLKANLGPIFIVWLILLGIGIVAGLILAVPFLALVAPVALAFMAGRGGTPSMPLLVAAGAGFLCYLPILIVLSGILQTWTTSVWTLAYRKFTGREAGTPVALDAAAPATT